MVGEKGFEPWFSGFPRSEEVQHITIKNFVKMDFPRVLCIKLNVDATIRENRCCLEVAAKQGRN
jgi:hypothetical protein